MGSYTSTLNDTSSTLYITYAANDQGLQVLDDFINGIETVDWSDDDAPEGTKAAVATATASTTSAASATTAATTTTSASGTTSDVTVASFIASVGSGALAQGYHAVSAGDSYVSDKLTLSLVHQADVILAEQINTTNMVMVYKGSFTVWSGATDGSTKTYTLSSQLGSLQSQAFEIASGTVVAVGTAAVVGAEQVVIQHIQAEEAAGQMDAATANAAIAQLQQAIAAQTAGQ
ncbi:hypothetical protein FB45DRAFT_1117309 [Roridomyces roridus]|uniref:Uncharacterized protein n=1 Tax=Roridomyces roridus TaxID=1738132 RepID=A0AAD7B889_9AGAR|nr:hypothetical protein FB45DRAFT_1117309 [Roridomyces roridus]